MAAHGRTIVLQCLKIIRDGKPVEGIVKFVEGALYAPGTCTTAGFDMDAHTAIWLANEKVARGEGTPEEVLVPVLERAVETHRWMDAYPTMEAVVAAKESYVRCKTPYWKARDRKFRAGDAAVHAQARASIAGRYPLTQRAPTIG